LVGVGLLLVLWGVRMVLERRPLLRRTPFLTVLAAWFALGVVQIIPLPPVLLRMLSPETVRLYDALLPTEPETLSNSEEVRPPLERGKTLSVYPGATRRFLLRLLALLALFAVVQENVASEASLRRLTIAATINGFALALLALFQYFRGPPNVIYGTFTAPAEVFGPFVCRNHFPFYLNMCIGLGLGWLLSVRREYHNLDQHPNVPLAVLQQPEVLWLGSGLGLMVTSVLLSRSRGGIVALLLATAGAGFLHLLYSRQRSRLDLPVVIGGVVLALTAWFGFDLVNDRLKTVWMGEALQETRAPLWSMLFPLVRDFPLFGTGLGTFEAVESLHRQSPRDVNVQYEHAHNEYLEAWIEGGLIGLFLVTALAGLAVAYAYRAYRRYVREESGGLILGAALALFTVVIHSFGDFGMHIPAIAVLATVIAAHLSVLGASEEPRLQPNATTGWRNKAWLVLGGFVILLGVLLGLEGWRTWRVHYHRSIGYAWLATDRPDRFTKAFPHFAEAARLDPDKARLHLEASRAYLSAVEEQTLPMELTQDLGQAVPWLSVVLSSSPADALLSPTANSLLTNAVWEPTLDEFENHLQSTLVVPGLRHLVRARDLAPTQGAPHVRLAANRSFFTQADPAQRYIERAMLLIPVDPELWYVGGLVALLEDDREKAIQCWHRSLELSDDFLEDILARSVAAFGLETTAERIVPDDPNRLLKAAVLLYPEPEQSPQRRTLFTRALQILQQRSEALSAEERHTLAELHRALDQKADALRTLREALQKQPTNLRWRLTYARWLLEDGQLEEARDEVRQILDQHPRHREAEQLRQEISDRRLRGQPNP
ncbi:MAG: O-antigen ligase family protein, partial [Gemmatales bacterium]|nr:O-antigen ligase family protein [Gemmatales bacterium]MDW8387582.1 O-antigen ligase family protein [Gemmatales bacterium]